MSLKSESENNPVKNLGKDDTEIELQLGDIIQITNPSVLTYFYRYLKKDRLH